MIDDAWLIWCDSARGWWRPDGKGYTLNVLEAGVYTRSEVDRRTSRDIDFPKRVCDVVLDVTTNPPEGTLAAYMKAHGQEG